MLSHINWSLFSTYRTSVPKTLHQRLKFYGRNPNFKLKTVMRPPDLNDPEITFPIRIPIRYRHEFVLQKKLIVPDSSKIHW